MQTLAAIEQVDVLIIGSGASGAAAAWSLSRSGQLKVLCLEQGERVDPAHYPSSRVDWELDREFSASSDPNVRRNKADYPIDCQASAVSLANFNGVGGSTILYSGHFPRFHPSDFATKHLDGVGADWPLSYQDLEPYFQLNEQMMGVAGLVGDPAYPDYLSLLPPVPLGEGGQTLARGFNQLGWHWWPSYAAINTKHHGGRPACINLGPCNTGCAQGAKASVDVTYWPQALRQGVELRTGCQVVHIATHTVNGQEQASGVYYLDAQGQQRRVAARVVVLAASGIGTPRLLLQSRSARFPHGLLNDFDLVGRHLMVHPLAYVEGLFPHDLQSSLGPQGCCLLSQEFYETRPEHDFVRGYTLHVLRGSAPVETAVKNLMLRRLPCGPTHHQQFAQLFNHNMGIAVITEDLPEWHNRVLLDWQHRDANGMPGLICQYQLADNTKAMLKHGIERSKQVIQAAGGTVSTAFGPVRHTGWHLMGTARMGDDPSTSVVNRFGQAHAVPNLFIVDSSIFVTAGAVNPVATAQALTLHCCDYLQKNFAALAGTAAAEHLAAAPALVVEHAPAQPADAAQQTNPAPQKTTEQQKTPAPQIDAPRHLVLLLDTVLPGDATLGLPSAQQADVALFLQRRGQLRLCDDYLTALESIAEQKCQAPWHTLDAASRLQCVDWSRRSHLQLASQALSQLLRGYYSAAAVLRQLNAGAVPPFPAGNTIADNDWDLLEPVFERGPIYRHV